MNSFTFILSKQPNSYCETLHKAITNSHIIYDVDFSDEEMIKLGFSGLTRTSANINSFIKITTAWDKAFWWIEQNYDILNKYEYFFFIEDDVYTSNINNFVDLFESLDMYNYDLITNDITTKEDSLDWFWWNQVSDTYKFDKQVKSFSPLCRLSPLLIKSTLQWRKNNGGFTFMEIIFSSICATEGFSYEDFENLEEIEYFGKFGFRPVIQLKEIKDDKIYHPVKPKYYKIT